LTGKAARRPAFGKLQGTDFQKQVWQAIGEIPAGKTITYGELAAAVGRPRASRAVANACGKNPLPLFIPCHRVVAANGKIGGFSAGLPWKKLLLSAEQNP
jgi:methylated-DNA-[protein]-cysteine S-methyltransferase